MLKAARPEDYMARVHSVAESLSENDDPRLRYEPATKGL